LVISEYIPNAWSAKINESSQWVCLNDTGIQSAFDEEMIAVENIGTYEIRNYEPIITVQIDNSRYYKGDTIIITGKVTNSASNTPVLIQTLHGVVSVDVAQVAIEQDGTYTKTLLAEGLLWKKGTYIIKVTYKNTTADLTFVFDDIEFKPEPIPDSIPEPTPEPEFDNELIDELMNTIAKLEAENTSLNIKNDELEKNVNDLKSEVDELVSEIGELISRILNLEDKIENLNLLVMEQVKVIYQWVVDR
jgi:hypothetical protein